METQNAVLTTYTFAANDPRAVNLESLDLSRSLSREPPLSLENRQERREKVGRRVGRLPTLVQPTALTERP